MVHSFEPGQGSDIARVEIPGGPALRGTDDPRMKGDEESPSHRTTLKPFAMMPTTVTNAMFAAFVEDTGYKTEAEKFGWSFVFLDTIPKAITESYAVAQAQWWRRIDQATWTSLHGPGSEDEWKPDHPVVQVSWNDARAFAQWAGGRLPTEAEWEHAARGGLGDVPYPWGVEEPDDHSYLPCNIWQGQFPHKNSVADGYFATAPARSFEPNAYGLYNMVGNVWEWTSEPFKIRSLSRQGKARAKETRGTKILKGGSYLCHKSYCYRYRIPARTGNTPDTATSHQGFRLVFDL